jgi:hypothetical protein
MQLPVTTNINGKDWHESGSVDADAFSLQGHNSSHERIGLSFVCMSLPHVYIFLSDSFVPCLIELN